MRGLLLKDFYLMTKYCRVYLFIIAVFAVGGLFGGQNYLFFYPCLLAGMVPVTLLAYDEQSRWNDYAGTMPYKKSQLVASKYLFGLFCGGAVLLLNAVIRWLSLDLNAQFSPGPYRSYMVMLLFVTVLSFSLSLPFMFALGVEKGRIVYMVLIGGLCAVMLTIPNFAQSDAMPLPESRLALPIAILISAVIYLTSWGLSVLLYRRRSEK